MDHMHLCSGLQHLVLARLHLLVFGSSSPIQLHTFRQDSPGPSIVIHVFYTTARFLLKSGLFWHTVSFGCVWVQ